MTKTCPICGCMSLEPKSGSFKFSPPDNVSEEAIYINDSEWFQCSECEEILIPPKLRERLDEARYSALGLLSPKSIQDIRVEAGLTQKEISEILGVGEKTYTRWESGRSIQNKSSDMLIRLFHKNSDMFLEVLAQKKPSRNLQISEYINSIKDVKGKNDYGLAAYGTTAEMDESIVSMIRERLQTAVKRGES